MFSLNLGPYELLALYIEFTIKQFAVINLSLATPQTF